GEIGRRLADKLLSPLETLLEAAGSIFQRAAHRESARREPALVERHQETDRSCTRIFILSSRPCAFPFYEARDVAVELEFSAVDLEVDGVRNALLEDWLRNP